MALMAATGSRGSSGAAVAVAAARVEVEVVLVRVPPLGVLGTLRAFDGDTGRLRLSIESVRKIKKLSSAEHDVSET